MMQKYDFSVVWSLHENRDAAVGFNIWWVLIISEKVGKGTPCNFGDQILNFLHKHHIWFEKLKIYENILAALFFIHIVYDLIGIKK